MSPQPPVAERPPSTRDLPRSGLPERHRRGCLPGPPITAEGARPRLTPRALARLHDAYRSALWHGDDVGAVATWLAAPWQSPAPPEPRRSPDAVSCGGGAGIRWYRQGAVIVGYPPGASTGCYRVSSWEVASVVPGHLHGGHALDVN